jgi:hypothetical protein
MCGRFKRGSDKQRVAKVFKVTAGLDETVFDEGDDLRPQSIQPVIYTNDAGERQMELMRWHSSCRTGCSLTHAQKASTMQSFGKTRSRQVAVFCPVTPSTNGRPSRRVRRNRSTSSPSPDNIHSGWQQSGSFGSTRKRSIGKRHSLSSPESPTN